MNVDELKYTLKKQIIEELNLEELTPEDIDDDAPLFGTGLGLDSIDSLELVVIMEKFHQVRIPDEIIGKEVLQSINTMANFIVKEREKTQ
ncbi:MAG: phosphopantetheine-binding protein [Bacteroidetes bacterium]|nr:phosphopantetheine-binding protein [Bacteroidota bacterium]